jgi:hypothetical protein
MAELPRPALLYNAIFLKLVNLLSRAGFIQTMIECGISQHRGV